jgi:HAD superfamily hydrolase (TIGR01484 family)
LKNMMKSNMKLKYVQFWRQLHNIISVEKDNIVKCEIMNKDIDKLKKVREELESVKEIEIVSSTKYNIEITNKGVSKGKAIEILASYYDIKKEEIVAIGNSENDLSMTEYAGTGVVKFINKFVCE